MLTDPDVQVATNLAVAALCGLAVGIEREWSGHASGPQARFAGARTFLLLGSLGGVAGWLFSIDVPVVAAILLSGAGALTIAAYLMAARRGGDAVEGTTEAAALVVLALGVAAGLGYLRLASAAASLMVLALAEKPTIQRFIQRIGQGEMQAALQFAVLALVILPLLPEGPYGPLGGIRPRSLWTVVLLFSGLNFAGYLSRRAVDEARGYGITGLLGGLVSSTAVTWSFARRSRTEPGMASSLALGVLGACTVLLPRVALITMMLNPVVARGLLAFLGPPLVVGAALVIPRFLGRPVVPAPPLTAPLRSPLQLGAAIQMAVAFQAVLMGLTFAREAWGSSGVLTSSVLLGLTDMDALTMSMSRLGKTEGLESLAARAIALGILSNTILKLGLVLGIGAKEFRRPAGLGLVALGAATGLGLWLGW